MAEKSAKVSTSDQTCGQRQKTGLFKPQRGKNKPVCHMVKTRYFAESRGNKRKGAVTFGETEKSQGDNKNQQNIK